VFYCDTCDWMDALREDVTTCPKCAAAVRQDEDVLDTWFSSQIWPFAVLSWPSGNMRGASEAIACRSRVSTRFASHDDPSYTSHAPRVNSELKFNYPTSTLSTAPDILFLWVARMIMSGLYFCDDIPFDDVIIHPTVFNKEGRRMSKSLGTGVDPLDLMEHYGADGMRFGLMLQVTGVQDMKFDEDKLLSSRNFANKIWNASRFVLMNTADYVQPEQLADIRPETLEDKWILSRLARLTERVTTGIDDFEFGDVSRELYNFFWNEYCDWYIELAKSRLNGSAEERAAVQHTLIFVLDKALRLLHPMMPYLTEEIWQKLPIHAATSGADDRPALIVADWTSPEDFAALRDEDAERRIELLKAVVSATRSTRARYQLSPRTELAVSVKASEASDEALLNELKTQITQLAHISELTIDTNLAKPAQSAATVAEGLEIYVSLVGLVDFEAEKARLTKERDKVAKDLAKLEKKLSNEGFLAKAAAEIIEKDRNKAADLRKALTKFDAQLEE